MQGFFVKMGSIKREFPKHGLMEISEIDEQIKHLDNEPPLKSLLIKCRKKSL